MPVDLVGYAHFENLNSISNIFQETQFLSFGRPTNYMYLRTTDSCFFNQGNVRHPT